MEKLTAAMGQEFGPQIVREEAKQFTISILRLTPPRSPSQGENKVRTDLNKVVTPLTAKNIKILFSFAGKKLQKRIMQLVGAFNDSDDYGISGQALTDLTAIIKNMPKLKYWQEINISQLPDIHKAARDNYGRVNGKRYNYTADVTQYNRYLQAVLNRVGLLKAGWGAAAWFLGINLPWYISRHGTQWGQVIPSLNTGSDPSMTMINDAVKLPGYEERVWKVLKFRETALATKLRAMALGKAVNLGFMTLPGETWFGGAQALSEPSDTVD